MSSAPRPDKLLFITSTYPGDAIISSGLLQHLLAKFPAARPTIVCGQPSAALFAEVPRLDRVIPIVKRKHHLHWPSLWRQLIATRWRFVLDLRGSPLTYTLRAAERRVFRPKARQGHQRITEWAHLLGLEELPPPTLWLAPRHETAAEQLLGTGPPVLALGPTANWHAKMWPADRFAELALRLTRHDGILPGARIAVIGRPGDEAAVEPILSAVPDHQLLNLVGKTDLLTLCAVLKRCAMYVGNDSGPLHISVAMGAPGLGLLGPGPGMFGPPQGPYIAPWAKRTDIVRTPKTFEELIAAPDYDPKTVGNLMESISVDAAEVAARRLWHRLHREAAPAAE